MDLQEQTYGIKCVLYKRDTQTFEMMK